MSKIGDYARTLPPSTGVSMMKICAEKLQKILTGQSLNPQQMFLLKQELRSIEPAVDWDIAVVKLLDTLLGID